MMYDQKKLELHDEGINHKGNATRTGNSRK